MWVDARKAEGFEVLAACRVAQVSASAYYEFMTRHGEGPTRGELDEAYLVNEIVDLHRHKDDCLGSPRMTDELRRRGHQVNQARGAAHGRQRHLCQGREAQEAADHDSDVSAPPLPDLGRDFAVGEPGLRTCGDITYVATDEGWLYLADVLDIGSRRIIGYAMASRMPTELVARAMQMAVVARGGAVDGMIFHADRGSQYLSREFRELCQSHGISQSTGRTGSSHDNAVAESLWATIKRELLSRYRFATRAEARRAIIAWVHHYNAVRLHSSLGNVPPIEGELRHWRSQMAERLEAA
jgi:putative transposase